jgi:tricorn protease
MKRTFLLLLSLVCMNLGMSQSDIELIRFPALSPDGQQLAFSYQGDIWTTRLEEGPARRLTIHESYEHSPQWSPDGTRLLFESNRFGNGDLFTMSAQGSTPQRLTYFSGSDGSAKWINNEDIVFTTRRAFAEVEREQEIYQLGRNGGTPFRIMDALGLSPAYSPDGRYLAFVKGSCRVDREAYRGPANRNIWIYDTKNKTYTQITDFDGQDIMPDWGADNELFFLSAQNGKYNVYTVKIDNGAAAGEPQAITNFRDEGIRYFDVSANGQKIAFERLTGIYLMNADGRGRPTEVKVDLTGDYRFDPVEKMTMRSNAREYEISPNGKYVALGIRGDIFLMPEDSDKSRAVSLDHHPARDEEITFLNDSTILFVSDRNGNNDIYMLRSSDPEQPNLYKTFKKEVKALTNTSEEEGNLVLSPDGTQLAFSRGRGQLVVADISADGQLSNEKILQDGWGGPSNVSWSPDSKWLAYDMPNLDFNREVYIHAADNSQEPVNVSMHPRVDSDPVWSADGSKLGFISNRNAQNDDIWFVWLKKEDWEKTQRDREEDEEEAPAKKNGKDEKVVVEIDFEDIHERLEQVTSMPGNENNLLISLDGETFYFTSNSGSRQGSEGAPSFYSIQWDGSDQEEIVARKSMFNLKWDKDGKNVYYSVGGQLNKLDLSNKRSKSLSFEARMELDHMAERAQIFDDAWRALGAGFYDPDFHGQDWEELRAKYRPRALAASTSQDFRDMFNDMLGQLNASHMGMYGSDPEDTQRDRSGLLGIEVMPTDDGLRVTRVVPGTPADRTDSKIEEGSVILAVNGTRLTPTTNLYELLEGQANERVLLNIRTPNGEETERTIRPAGSIRGDLYENWVQTRKELTEKYSNGRLGYIHIQGMNWPSFERFERELTASGLGKEGIVIDVRFNGGGWTTDMLMTVLNVRQHSYTIPRGAASSLDKENKKFTEHYPFGERLPLSSWTRPSVALCNHTSYSNAEIFSHAYKTLDIGTLVGEPTFGAVISTGSHSLKDGSRVRMPYRAWYVKATGENMEHGPAVPDVIVMNEPESKAKGEDPQLKKAVEVLLQQLDEE